ncbi:fibronectin type III domain-containing protein, partial [bacterium]|nr:fibronectin type III domain-containing protein [bacterium]
AEIATAFSGFVSTGFAITNAAETNTSGSNNYRYVAWKKNAGIIITLSQTGTQTANMTIPSADNYIGAAFTLVTDVNSANITSITINEEGTVNATTNLSNLDIRYETAGTCTYNGTETLFGTDSSFDASQTATVTGNMYVSTSQVCVYAIVDVGAGAVNNETLDLEVTAPATDVITNSGVVSPITAVLLSGSTILQSGGNTAPNVPTALAQKKVTGGTTLATGDWTNENQVQFTATASDPDASDTLYLCVEKDNINTALAAANGGDLCGTGVAYSGTPVTVTVTITGMTDATEYHWRAQVRDTAVAYSAYVAYGANPAGDGTTDGNPANRDFGIDTTAPTGGTVNDGLAADTDYNNGTLDTLSANWSGFTSTVAGLNRYEYAIGTTQGGTQVVNWTNNNTSTSVTVGSLSLRTSQKYYFSVRAVDNAGGTGTAVNSNGQEVLPQISFTLNESSVLFNNLNTTNSWTDTKTSTFTTTTNAYNGYSVIAYATDYLRSIAYPSVFISDFQGTYAAPETWAPPGDSKYGFGYSTSDCDVNSALFWTGVSCTGSQKYARFSQSAPGDKVADHAGGIIGSPITNETFTISYRLAVQGSQAASTYRTNITYVIAPNF